MKMHLNEYKQAYYWFSDSWCSRKDFEKELSSFNVSTRFIRGMVKNRTLLRRASNNGRHCVHAVMCDNKYKDICMIIHGDSCLNLVKSVNRYRLHMTVRRTTRAYHRTVATKGLFITCPSANIIWLKGKLILRVNDSGTLFGNNG